MKCPRCGLINASSSERCDCGHSFNDGSFVQPTVQPEKPGERLRKAGCVVAVAAFLLTVLAARSSSLAVRALGDLFMVVVFLAFAAWVIGTLRSRKANR